MGHPFVLYKFRTMRDLRDDHGNLRDDAARLTPLGRMLRRWSLDELPQFWNVLRGDMSLVGPRPLLLRYRERYDDRQRRRLEVPPGITGWAQVMGRNALGWPEKFELDVWYVEHASLPLDLWILARTLVIALVPSGISASQHATMPEFLGNSSCRATTPGHRPRPHEYADKT
jgi:lipopolysaccharide/colanic/teichoic acid biosynthesis glycosyltransferase